MKLIFKLALCFFYSFSLINAQHIETIYGTFEINEPVILELLESKALCRLKEVHQYGVDHYIHHTTLPYSRYTHSVGVFALLRKYGAPLLEQIAGLLHDASHTVFSHVGDHVLAQLNKRSVDQNNEAYQDNKHEWLLAQTDIPGILAKYDLTLSDINHTNNVFTMLKSPHPDICADRLEYNLYGGYIENLLNKADIDNMLNSLHCQDSQWFFDNVSCARKFANVSIYLCEHVFASAWGNRSYDFAAQALLRAIDINLLNMNDIHFGRDDATFALLQSSDDATIINALNKLLNAKKPYTPSNTHNYDFTYTAKFRGIDPWVQTKDGLKRLTTCDTSFAQYFNKAKKRIGRKHYYLEQN